MVSIGVCLKLSPGQLYKAGRAKFFLFGGPKKLARAIPLCYHAFVGFLTKFIAKIVLNAIALFLIAQYFPGFLLSGGLPALIIGALVLTALNMFLRPILHLIATPLIWVTFGLFGIIIHIIILWIADQVLVQLAITNLTTLFWASIILALVNSFF